MANQIKIIPAQVHNQSQHGGTVLRTTYSNSAQNQNLLKKLYAIVGDDFEINKGFDFSGVKTPSLDDLKNLLSEVIIRFDNDPDYYDKRDYQYLIWYLCKNLIYILNTDKSDELEQIETSISNLENRVEAREETFDKLQVDKRIFATKAELEHAISNPKFTVSGQIFSVTDDGDNNGAYLVKPGEEENTLAIIKIATGEQTMLTLDAHEDVATFINNVLTIKDMRTYWGDKSFN